MTAFSKYLHLNLPTPQQVATEEIEAAEAEFDEETERDAARDRAAGEPPVMQLRITLAQDGGLFINVDCDESRPRNAEGVARCLARLFNGGLNDSFNELLVANCSKLSSKLFYEDVLRRIDQIERLRNEPIVRPCNFTKWNGASDD